MHITRQLRKKQTPWESEFWNTVRNRHINGLKFRRQTKIGNYIVDFLCLEKKLIIELDGGQHNFEQNVVDDKIRQSSLESQGYKILRFWNIDIDNNLDGVIQTIIQHS